MDWEALACIEELDEERRRTPEVRGMLRPQPALGVGLQRVAEVLSARKPERPSSSIPKRGVAEPTQSSGRYPSPSLIPRSSAIASPPR